MSSIITLKSVALGLGMALGVGGIMYGAAKLARFTPAVGLYHGIIWSTFFGLYYLIPGGFESHFYVPPSKQKMNAADIAYYTMVTHSGVGYGDIYPVTTAARLLVSLHLFCSILAVFNMVPVGESTLSYASFDVDPYAAPIKF